MKDPLKNVTILGCGYIGLPLALFLAKAGHFVLGVDVDKNKIAQLKSERYIMFETGFQDLWNDETVKKNLNFSTKPRPSDIFIICVPTPLNSTRDGIFSDYLTNAIKMILPLIQKGNLIILESTVPPGTCQREIFEPIKNKYSQEYAESILIAHCPERVFPGNIFEEFVNDDRIIGGITEESAITAKKLYETFVKGKCIITDVQTAEFCKLAENTFRMINIALANELEELAREFGVNAQTAIKIANLHPRVRILNPGIGIGGHCIPKDPVYLLSKEGSTGELIKSGLKINQNRPHIITERIISYLKNKRAKNDAQILLLGKSYKPDVKDDRESPAYVIANLLKESGLKITHVDPYFETIKPITSLAVNFNAIIVLVPHKILLDEIKQDENIIQEVMQDPKVIIADIMKI